MMRAYTVVGPAVPSPNAANALQPITTVSGVIYNNWGYVVARLCSMLLVLSLPRWTCMRALGIQIQDPLPTYTYATLPCAARYSVLSNNTLLRLPPRF